MNENKWALVLGASSGFGEAVGLELSKNGFNIAGVHLDRKNTMPHVEEVIHEIKQNGRKTLFLNVNAADEEKRKEVLEKLAEEKVAIKILLHSLAFGTLKSFISTNSHDEGITKSQLEMTLDVMAHSLVYWTQDLIKQGLMKEGGRIFAMTSEGGTHVIPSYGAVSAAKAALESHVRQLAYELAPLKITVNAIRAGVTDTPALRKIPGNDRLIDHAKIRNPHGRLTTPEDVAKAIVAFSNPETAWMTGNVIGVDGGECVVA
jgi:NAD(P)-dependent dehydrogenase (short-subunit alcohol dehydrogenase family)